MAIRKYVPVASLLVVLLAALAASPASAANPQTITFESTPPTPAVIGGTYVVTARATSGLPVSLASPTTSVCSLSGSSSGSTVTFKTKGPCTIDANQPGNAEWAAAPQAHQEFTVENKPQTIKFESTPPNPGLVGGSYNVSATGGGSGNPVTLTVDATSISVCSIKEATVSFIAEGTCTIDANQAGSETYEAAPQVQQAITVHKKPQTITFKSSPPSPANVGGTYNTEVSASSGLAVTISTTTLEICTASGSTVTFGGVGECKVVATQSGNNEYEEATFTQGFMVLKGKQAIAFTSAPPEGAAPGGSYAPTASGGKSGNSVVITVDPGSGSVCVLSASTVRLIGPGTCTLDANQAGDSNYEPASQVQQSFAVRIPQSVAFTSSPPNPAQVGGTYVTSAAASSGLPVSFFVPTTSVCTISGSTVTFIAAGICTVEAEQAGNAEYAVAPQVQQSFVVSAPPAPPAPGPPAPGPPAPIVHVKPVVIPNSSFKVVGASLSLATYAITFVESVSDPGTFTWVLTFENGKFGVFAAAKTCKAGSIRIKGKCRPARVLFARGSKTVAAAGSATFTVKPTRAGVQALRKAFTLHRGLPVTAEVTFQSARGGQPAVRVQSLIVKGRK